MVKNVFGVTKGKNISISKESKLYYDNSKTGKRERLDGKTGKLTDIYSEKEIGVTFKDGSSARTPTAFVNYTKTPEYKKRFN